MPKINMQNIVAILLLSALALSTLLLEHNYQSNLFLSNFQNIKPDISGKQIINTNPEYVITAFNSKSFNKDSGVLEYKIISQSVEYFKESKESFFKQPNIDIYKNIHEAPLQKLWEINSSNAKTKSLSDIIQLEDNVTLERIPQNENETPLEINSNNLTFFLDKKLVTTDSIVEIISGLNKTTGIGLQAEINNEKLTIFQKVQSEYLGNNQQLTHISSNQLVLENLENKASYLNNAQLSQENIQIFANELKFLQKNNQRIAIATGSPASFKQTLKDGKQDIYAQAMRLEFDTQDKILKMYDNAKLQQGDATIAGAYLYYDTRKETIGAESTEATRVKLVIPAKEKNKPN